MKQRYFLAFALAALASALMVNARDGDTGSDGDKSTHGYHHRFNNAQHWARVFDDPSRDIWQKPDQVVASLKLKATDKIADIGAGTGYFSVRMAKVVSAGKVFAVDTESDMIKYLAQLAKEKNLANLFPVQALPDNPELTEKIDLVLIVDTLHHIDSRMQYLAYLKGQLLPHGRLVVIDFNKRSKVGPPAAHRLAKDSVIHEVESAGYHLEEDLDYLPNQYFLVFNNQ